MRRGNGAYQVDFRRRVVGAYNNQPSATFESVARAHGCAPESVRRWVRAEDHENLDARPMSPTAAGDDVREVLWIARGELAIVREALEAAEGMLDAIARRYGPHHPGHSDEPLNIQF